jgi:hydroxylamine reductase
MLAGSRPLAAARASVAAAVRASTLRRAAPASVAAASSAVRSHAPPAAARHHQQRGMASAADAKQPEMFCFQCEQTESGTGCTTLGVCGKTPETAALQDLLVHQVKGLSLFSSRLHEMGRSDQELDEFLLRAMFSTLTNVNFDPDRFANDYCVRATELIAKAEKLYRAAGGTDDIDSSQFAVTGTAEELEAFARDHASVWKRRQDLGEDIAGLLELITYGAKGVAAYTTHELDASGNMNTEALKTLTMALAAIASEPDDGFDANTLTGLALKLGECNLNVMGGLEAAHLERFGIPSPQHVPTTPLTGKSILVSGHDLVDLEALLKQTEGKGINVYTHGEMLPAHGYPELKKYKHLIGNYGGAWQLQKFDFATFPGPIVMTSNCIVEPRKSYTDRIWTKNSVGWPGVKHLADHDYSAVIDQALELPGFDKVPPEQSFVTTGFGKDAVLGAAGAVVEAVQAGNLKHFFVIGGCDGSETERSYFHDLAMATPQESMIITIGCGKYRFNKENLGTIPGDSGLPRVLDMGQCNDAFGAIQVAVALQHAFGAASVNDLPLSFAVSWFEQKAVAVLLTLLHLGIQDIRLGPELPAFVSPAVLDVLVKGFGLRPINTDYAQEIQDMMAKK